MAPPLKAPVGAVPIPKKIPLTKLEQWAGVKVSTAKPVGNSKSDVLYVQSLLVQWAGKWNACASDKVPAVFDRPALINGSINHDYHKSTTIKAIKSFQQKVLQRKTPGGIVYPKGKSVFALEAIRDSTGFSELATSGSKMVHAVFCFIARFGPVQINGGKRSEHRQAELMAGMDDKKLNMYGENSSYIPKIKALPKGTNGLRDVTKVEEIIVAARKAGSFVSHHIGEDAVDIQISAGFDMVKAQKVAKELGLKSLDETPFGNKCFHINF